MSMATTAAMDTDNESVNAGYMGRGSDGGDTRRGSTCSGVSGVTSVGPCPKRKRGEGLHEHVHVEEAKDRFRKEVAEILCAISGKTIARVHYEAVEHGLRQLTDLFTDVLLEREHMAGRMAEQDRFRTILSRLDERDSRLASAPQQAGETGAPVAAPRTAVNGGGSSSTSGGGSGVRSSGAGDAQPKRKSYAVVVRSGGETTLTADEVWNRVMTDVRAAAPTLRVNAVRRVKNGVALEVTDRKTVDAIKACKKFGEVGLAVKDPRKIGPKVIIYDVPAEYRVEKNKLIQELYNSNVEGVPMPDYLVSTRVVSLSESTLILEVSPATKASLMRRGGRVTLGWESCRMREN